MRTAVLQKPPRGSMVDRAHPLARGLRHLFVMNEGAGWPRDIITHRDPDLIDTYTTRNWIASQYGIALQTGGCGLQWNTSGVVNEPFTALVFARPNAAYDSLIVIHDGTYETLRFATYNVATAWRIRVYSDTNDILNCPPVMHCAGVVAHGPNDHRRFLNGVKVGTDTSTTVATASNPTLTLFAQHDNSSSPFSGDVGCIALWDRALSDREVAAFSRNPWQLFRLLPLVGVYSEPETGGDEDKTQTDTGTGTDLAELTAKAVEVADSGVGSDVAVSDADQVAADAGAGAGVAEVVGQEYPQTDAGSGGDVSEVAEASLPLTDNFSGGHGSLDGQQTSGGGHKWSDGGGGGLSDIGGVAVGDNASGWAWAHIANMPDVPAIRFQFKLVTGYGQRAMILWDDANQYGYGVQVFGSSKTLKVVRVDGDVAGETILGSDGSNASNGDTILITVDLSGNFEVYLNGSLDITGITDTTYTTGKVGLAINAKRGTVDDVQVTENTVEVKAQTDTGAGADVVASEVDETQDDTGTGTDAVTAGAPIVQTDLGGGADQAEALVDETVADSGAGTDAGEVEAQVPVADAGAGSGATVVDAGSGDKATTDTGAGADDSTSEVDETQTDVGAGDDQATAGAPVEPTDSGSGSDVAAVSDQKAEPTDSGAGTEAIITTAAHQVAESGGGVDLASVSVLIVLAEAGSPGADVAAVSVGPVQTDAGAGSEVVTVPTVVLVEADPAAAASEVATVVADLLQEDIGLGVDLPTLTDLLVLAEETGTALEVATSDVTAAPLGYAVVDTRRKMIAYARTREH